MSDLKVEFVPLRGDRRSRWYPDLEGIEFPPAWRVGIESEGRSFPMAFARESDGERAKAALEREGLCTIEAIAEAGRQRVEQIMLEAMQW